MPSRARDTWGRVVRVLWASPVSFVGVLLAPFFDRRSIVRGLLVCEGASWPRRLGWRYRAITFGHVVLAVEELDEETFDHEDVHVAQYEVWGPVMPVAYAAASVWVALRHRHYYRDNPFEVAARRSTR